MTNTTKNPPHILEGLLNLTIPKDRATIIKLAMEFMARGGEGGWACFTFSDHEEEPQTVDIQIVQDGAEESDWLSTLVLDLAALEQLGFHKLDSYQC
jgi:hypothetical protein